MSSFILFSICETYCTLAIDERSREELSAKMRQLTALENPNSVQQMKEWLTKHGLEVDSLDKKAVKELLKTAPPELAEVLELRRQLAKSSVKKYQAMQNAVCADGRARGMFQFYGANRSGRWAGRLIQLQNLPQNHMTHLEDARSLVRSGDYALLSALYDSVPEVLSELIRTAFVPKDGYKFIVSDFSAIEARVLSFLAGESWRLKVFAENGDIYCASASAMFHVPVEKHGQNAHLRQKGKIAELALGYGGSVGALDCPCGIAYRGGGGIGDGKFVASGNHSCGLLSLCAGGCDTCRCHRCNRKCLAPRRTCPKR